jgi:hypothetical protein
MKKSPAPLLAWHFLLDSHEFNHGPFVKAAAGKTYHAKGPLVICSNGMHASRNILDALYYAPGACISRVEMSGPMVLSHDKLCARHRKVLWMADATRPLHDFTLWAAHRALEAERAAGGVPDPRSVSGLVCKQAWLDGQATFDELTEAHQIAYAVYSEIEQDSFANGYAGPSKYHFAATRATTRAAYTAALACSSFAYSCYSQYGSNDSPTEKAHQNAHLTQIIMGLAPAGYTETS